MGELVRRDSSAFFFYLGGYGGFKVEQSKDIQYKVYSLLERPVFLLKLIFRKGHLFFIFSLKKLRSMPPTAFLK